MDITEIGVSRQIRILQNDYDRLTKLKIVPTEPWYKEITRLLDDLEWYRKHCPKKP